MQLGPDASRGLQRWRERLPDTPVLASSSATGLGIQELAAELFRRVPAREQQPVGVCAPAGGAGRAEPEPIEHMVFRPSGPGGTGRRTGR